MPVPVGGFVSACQVWHLVAAGLGADHLNCFAVVPSPPPPVKLVSTNTSIPFENVKVLSKVTSIQVPATSIAEEILPDQTVVEPDEAVAYVDEDTMEAVEFFILITTGVLAAGELTELR